MGWPKSVHRPLELNKRQSIAMLGIKRPASYYKNFHAAVKRCWKNKEYRENFRKLRSGTNHEAWKGEKVGLKCLHKWLSRHYGRAFKCENIRCKKPSRLFDWANISGKYLRDRKDFIQLCRKCHIRFDRNLIYVFVRGKGILVQTKIYIKKHHKYWLAHHEQ